MDFALHSFVDVYPIMFVARERVILLLWSKLLDTKQMYAVDSRKVFSINILFQKKLLKAMYNKSSHTSARMHGLLRGILLLYPYLSLSWPFFFLTRSIEFYIRLSLFGHKATRHLNTRIP